LEIKVRALELQAGRQRLRAPKRLLGLAGDERLVEEIRAGNERAFEVAFERHGSGVLSFCRHMLGSHEEAEEALQHTFAAAWSDLARNPRPIRLKAWLYTIARNRCLSVLRARRETPAELEERVSTAGLADEVAERFELRALLADLRELPDEQRAALVLAELGDLSHAEIAEVLGRKEDDVKAIVFRARSGLADRREARDTPCTEIREQLSVLRGGALRRRTLRYHLQHCPGCAEFREQVKAQRRMMALVLPVVPSVGLKHTVLAAAGLGGGAAGGGAAAGFGTAVVAKLAIAGVVVGGAVTVGDQVIDGREPVRGGGAAEPAGTGSPGSVGDRGGEAATGAPVAAGRAGAGARDRPGTRRQGAAGERGRERSRAPGASRLAPPATPVRAKGSPPALGRVRRGLAPPQPGTGTGQGRGVGRRREAAGAPREAKPVKESPRPVKERAKPVREKPVVEPPAGTEPQLLP
jgi:RNA polymerase sigma factor (sigma-70 family)